MSWQREIAEKKITIGFEDAANFPKCDTFYRFIEMVKNQTADDDVSASLHKRQSINGGDMKVDILLRSFTLGNVNNSRIYINPSKLQIRTPLTNETQDRPWSASEVNHCSSLRSMCYHFTCHPFPNTTRKRPCHRLVRGREKMVMKCRNERFSARHIYVATVIFVMMPLCVVVFMHGKDGYETSPKAISAACRFRALCRRPSAFPATVQRCEYAPSAGAE